MDFEVSENYCEKAKELIKKSALELRERYGLIEGDKNKDCFYVEGIVDCSDNFTKKRDLEKIVYSKEFEGFFRERLKNGEAIGHVHTHFVWGSLGPADLVFFNKYGLNNIYSIVSPSEIVFYCGGEAKIEQLNVEFSERERMHLDLASCYQRALEEEPMQHFGKVREYQSRIYEVIDNDNDQGIESIIKELDNIYLEGLFE